MPTVIPSSISAKTKTPLSAAYELVSHACILFDFGGFKVLTDPWLIGSSSYRSWWHLPKPSKTPEELSSSIQAIVISHAHSDHFHTPTLKKFPKDIPVWIPKLFCRDFYERTKAVGFAHVHEMDHGRTYSLPNGLKMTNYTYRADDSLFVFEYGGQGWIHFNDCLVEGATLKEIIRRHRPIHTIFNIYANAEAYPYCYKEGDQSELENWSNKTILDAFLQMASSVKPRYAVPYAGFVGAFHRESEEVDPFFASPLDVLRRAQEINFTGPELKILWPGDSWSSDKGFAAKENYIFDRKQEWDRRKMEIQAKLEEHYQTESPCPDAFRFFQSYFKEYFRKVPFFLLKKIRLKIAFQMTDLKETYLLDLPDKTLTRFPGFEKADVQVRLTSYLFHRAIEDRNWIVASGSYRFRFYLKPGVRSQEALFWVTVFLCDAGYFDLRNYLTLRFLSVLWRRRLEFSSYAFQFLNGSFVESKIQKKYNRLDKEESVEPVKA